MACTKTLQIKYLQEFDARSKCANWITPMDYNMDHQQSQCMHDIHGLSSTA
jgi:hypothetical protein